MPSNVTWSAAHDPPCPSSTTPRPPIDHPLTSCVPEPLADPQTALLTSLVSLILSNRREVYRAPGLSDVANNGGSRINQRLLLMLRKMCTDFGERGLVDELVRAQQAQKPGGGRKRKSDTAEEDERKVKIEKVEKQKGGKEEKDEKGGVGGMGEREKTKKEMRDEILRGDHEIMPKFQY
ncbi:hypothetical protein A1Q2_04969 [Trichosporon asahii var. asahii CBS 8904]|uniref:Uncharacterized protein n=1 Tax=Trichosporon asahii var. asahii (strain CBS 8904) TaxID=1220162 RepID=K1VMZ2_TRIAC|nr:hypothetical protein A1Q2_04969 [Trichosporon asahii var. asahii CBS 8904]